MEKIPYPKDIAKADFIGEEAALKTKYGLPADVEFCVKCVISNQRPNSAVEYTTQRDSKKKTIHFDEHGVCDACNFAKKKKRPP
jgi:hypothetical protein